VHHCTYAHAHTVTDFGTKLQTNDAANNNTVLHSNGATTERPPHGSPNDGTDTAAHSHTLHITINFANKIPN
jgi:hypothetical protein